MPAPGLFVAMALHIEDQGVLTGAGVDALVTGLGKVNAALALARRVAERRLTGEPPSRVVNFGTAGSRRFRTGVLVGGHRFVQPDRDVSPLGFPHGHTP